MDWTTHGNWTRARGVVASRPAREGRGGLWPGVKGGARGGTRPWRNTTTAAVVALSLTLLAAPVEAANVSVYGALHGANRALRFGTTSATLSIDGFANQFDFGLDEVQARASVASGTLRILAREGGQPSSTGARFGAIAGATLRESVTITGIPGPRMPITLGYHVSADPDTLLNETGNALGSGRAHARVFGSFFIESTFRGANGFTRTERGEASFSQLTSHDFAPASPSVQGQVTPNGPFLTLSDHIGSSRPHLPIERTIAVRANPTVNAINRFGLDIQIDVLAAPGDTIVIGAALEAEVDGTTGTFASLNALHTGALSLNLPQGLGFVSDSGVFLTAAVPLPPGLALMLPALAGLGLAGLRRTPARLRPRGTTLFPDRHDSP